MPILCVSGAMIACACASKAPPKPAPPASEPIAVVVGAPEEAAEPVEVSAAATRLVVSAKSPTALLAGFTHAYQGSVLETFIKEATTEFAVEKLLGSDARAVLDLSQPAYFVLLDEDVGAEAPYVFSIGLKPDYSEAKLNAALAVLERGGADAKLAGALDCEAQTRSRTPPRLVCTDARELSAAMALTMNLLAARAVGPDLSLEIPREVVRRELAKFKRRELDGELDEFGKQQVGELLDAAGAVRADLRLVGTNLKLSSEIEITASDALLPTLLVGDAPSALPPDFAGLPEDANFAVSAAGITDALLSAPAVDEVWTQFEREMHERHPDGQTKLLVNQLRKLVLTGGPLLLASGPPSPAQSSLLNTGKTVAQRRLGLEGWWVIGVRQPLSEVVTAINALLSLNQRAFTQSTGRSPRPKVRSIAKHPLAQGSGLPKGTLYLRARETNNPRYRWSAGQKLPLETTTHTYITGDESATWIVLSEHNPLALTKARHLLTRAVAQTHRKYLRPEALDSARVLGFFTPMGLMQPFLSSKTDHGIARSQRKLESLEDLDEAGLDPVAFRYTVRDGQAVKIARFELDLDVRIVQKGLAPLFGLVFTGVAQDIARAPNR